MKSQPNAGRWLAAALVLCGVLSNLATSVAPPECGSAERIVTAVGDNQTGAATAPLGQSVGVRVQCNAKGSGQLINVFDEAVQWTVTGGGGLVNGGTAVTTGSVNDYAAVAFVANWQLGPLIGLQTLGLRVAGREFTLTAQAGGAATGGTCTGGAGTTFSAERIIVGNERWTLAGSPYRAVQVRVRDGATLSIEAGVTACLQSLWVDSNSRLMVAGQGGLPVRMTARDSVASRWDLRLGGDGMNTGSLPASVMRHVTGENLTRFSNDDQPLLIEDSSFVVDSTLRASGGCASFGWSLLSAGTAGAGSAVRRVVLDGYGGAPGACAAAVALFASAVPAGGPMPFEARVLRPSGDGVSVRGSAAAAFALVNCEVSGSGRDGVVLDSTGAAPGATIAGCHIVGNAGYGVLNRQGPGAVASARGNWWGSAAGAALTGANALSAGVDASSPAITPPALGY